MSKLNLNSWVIFTLLGLLLISATTIDKNVFPWNNGFLNGPIQITLTQGAKGKLQGNFKNNQKTGTWILYDKKGKVLQERTYENNFEYYTKLADGKEYTSPELTRNSKGVYEYATINEKDVSLARRLWLTMDNKMIYTNSNIYRVLSQIELSKQKAYASDALDKEVDPKLALKNDFNEMEELQIMVDFFYDNNRKLSECRVLALNPVMQDTSIQEVWYYYPDLRNTFAKIQVESENPMINNLDDLFFFGEYPYLIYKVENVQDTSFARDKSLSSNTVNEIKKLLEAEALLWQSK